MSEDRVNYADWLVVDHYGLDATWELQVTRKLNNGSICKVLVIDDLADRHHQAEILLDQNFFGENTDQRYQNLVPAHCRQLLGPHYALLGPEYAQLQPKVSPRTQLKRILVFFGGVDASNLTSQTLEALSRKELEHLEVDVVLGRQSPHRGAVLELAARRPRTTLHDSLPSLAKLIARADLAIGAGGTTTLERNCLKLPSLVVTIADNQKPLTEALAEAGHLELLGDANTVNTETIYSALLARIRDYPQTCQYAGGNLTDGLGGLRLAVALLGPQTPVRLRRADTYDEELLLRWANESQSRENSFSSDLITPYNHSQWYARGLANPNQLLLIASIEDGIPIGQIRFNKQVSTMEGVTKP